MRKSFAGLRLGCPLLQHLCPKPHSHAHIRLRTLGHRSPSRLGGARNPHSNPPTRDRLHHEYFPESTVPHHHLQRPIRTYSTGLLVCLVGRTWSGFRRRDGLKGGSARCGAHAEVLTGNDGVFAWDAKVYGEDVAAGRGRKW